ncbi:MAG: hypothetical protein ACLSHC_00805 [Bilophila wadsworthia]
MEHLRAAPARFAHKFAICPARTNEENYLAAKLTRAVIGSPNIDHCARL